MDKIIKKFLKHNKNPDEKYTICIYPSKTKIVNNTGVIYNIDNIGNIDNIDNTENTIKKFKKKNVIKTKQTETYFRDLVKIDSNTGTTYHKKKTIAQKYKNYLIVITILKDILPEQFPNISNYDMIVKKNINQIEYDYVDILVTEENNNTTICIVIKNINKFSNELDLLELID